MRIMSAVGGFSFLLAWVGSLRSVNVLMDRISDLAYDIETVLFTWLVHYCMFAPFCVCTMYIIMICFCMNECLLTAPPSENYRVTKSIDPQFFFVSLETGALRYVFTCPSADS